VTRAPAAEGGSAPPDPLAAFLLDLRARVAPSVVPGFDPKDGGVEARVLLLLEKPGPGALASGTVSRDNASLTSRAVRSFLEEAGLPRKDTVLWNVVPGWNGTMRVTGSEVREGLGHLARLLPLLPRLDTVILAGRHAGRAAPLLDGLRLIATAHPSPNVRAAFPDRWSAIPGTWARARR
jgi:uracil-DNA glycosylase